MRDINSSARSFLFTMPKAVKAMKAMKATKKPAAPDVRQPMKAMKATKKVTKKPSGSFRVNVCSTNEGNDGCSGKQSRPTFAMWSNKFRRTLISQGPTASMHDLNEHVRRLYGNSECALMMKTLTDASEPAADMDEPKTKIAKTAVAAAMKATKKATFEEDHV